ncbi:GSCOCG00000224001-RA-CDS [Cotesia congregata]|uniref:Large ribosomal subunit protein bL34m n=2 Tax=Cotesia TaxID=32390 RepID=A0A8J2MQF9_COTCN|nr:uncharacterized protein LOC123258633 [Cotesia glomerata]KAH0540823.1 hypothetical protein KQX54_020106 [Cotesia glomerata]CAD6201424.1 GSCOCG00000224001-RA-CDS [Cotesia congregata]CAG5101153.1 Similar to mRpL34: 39S ribosomal protein L34 [Cotesia congregata]
MFGKIIPIFTQVIPSIGIKTVRQFNTTYTALKGVRQVPWKIDHTKWPMTPIRRKMRDNFPYPNEVKRVRTHGYQTRMSTLHGRKILMRRILAGRFILSH